MDPGSRPPRVTAKPYLEMMNAKWNYTRSERIRAIEWKLATPTLHDDARRGAPYVGASGKASGKVRDVCLPAEHAALSLLPEVRAVALDLFGELGIPWHAGVGYGPGNHLLSSQVQCVNALGQMVHDPSRIQLAFGDLLGTAEVLEIEPGRHLTFEYIGDIDHFGEAPGGTRIRGAHCTSFDAAFVHRTVDGQVELVLIEWKYTESYRPRHIDPAKDQIRWSRYGSALMAPDSPVRGDLLAFTDLLDEPLYQLVRQQLLAHELEKAGAHGADVVRVLHVLPAENTAYQQSLQRPAQLGVGPTASEVWQHLLRRPDRFASIDSALVRDPAITSPEYVARYGGTWDAFTDRLIAVLDGLEQGQYLVLGTRNGRFAQIAIQDGDLRVETVSNQYLPASAAFDHDELAELARLGWTPPTHFADEDDQHTEGSPNHWLDLPGEWPRDDLAKLLTATLRRLDPTGLPDDLSYLAEDHELGPFEVPQLGVERGVR